MSFRSADKSYMAFLIDFKLLRLRFVNGRLSKKLRSVSGVWEVLSGLFKFVEFFERFLETLAGLPPPFIMATVLCVRVLFILFLNNVLKEMSLSRFRSLSGDFNITRLISPYLTTP